jgi:hypothetical protein
MRSNLALAAALVAALGIAGNASALTIPFTEDFASDAVGWEDALNNPLTWNAAGGPDGSSYVSTNFNYFGFSSPFGGGPVTFRATASDNPSGGAFIGDWLAGGVAALSVFVLQETGFDLTFFLRVATNFNFPGAVINNETVVPSGEWTQLVFPIDPDSPLCLVEGTTCAGALSNVGNLQLGTSAPAALTGLDQAFFLAIDQVSLVPVPEPGTALLLGGSLLALGAAGRRQR